jgi:RNA polymerase sigma factor (TIGR02999 family)
MPLVVDELQVIAESYFRRENSDHTWGPNALVNELYLLLADRRQVHWQNPQHFFCVAAELMRRLLVDRARRRRAAKRGGGVIKLPITEEVPDTCGDDPANRIALDEALERLEAIAPRQRQVVELKCFAGLTIREIGERLRVRPTTVKKDWRSARAWLVRELRHRGPTAAG